MSGNVVPLPVPTGAPGLAEVLADPGLLAKLPVRALLDLRRQVRHLEVDLDHVLVLAAQREPVPAAQESDRWLSLKEAAGKLGVTPRWLREHAEEIPGFRRLSTKVLRFSEAGLRRSLAGRR
jgi:hypothetical protein